MSNIPSQQKFRAKALPQSEKFCARKAWAAKGITVPATPKRNKRKNVKAGK